MISQAPIFTIHAELADIRHFGTTPYGERRVIDILGGRVEGPRLQGRILPGADWQIVRPDGVTDLEARYAIETDRGTRVVVRSDGLRHGPPEVIAALARGEAVEPSRYYFRTVMRFETADPALARKYLDAGALFVAVGIDTLLLIRAAGDLRALFTDARPQSR